MALLAVAAQDDKKSESQKLHLPSVCSRTGSWMDPCRWTGRASLSQFWRDVVIEALQGPEHLPRNSESSAPLQCGRQRTWLWWHRSIHTRPWL